MRRPLTEAAIQLIRKEKTAVVSQLTPDEIEDNLTLINGCSAESALFDDEVTALYEEFQEIVLAWPSPSNPASTYPVNSATATKTPFSSSNGEDGHIHLRIPIE